MKLLKSFQKMFLRAMVFHTESFQNIINYDLKKDKRDFKAVDTLNTLKLLHMMYKSSEKILIKIKIKTLIQN